MDHFRQQFRLLDDTRSQKELLHQQEVVVDMQRNNIRNFRMVLTEKQKVQYTPSKLFRVDLGDGWYCHITDNGLKDKRFTVLTVHGCPGDHRQWAGLEKEMQSSCRWVNLVVPGFDGEDERRGNYTGSMKDFSELIVRLMGKLGVAKLVLCFHSMGSIYMCHFVTHYRRYVQGIVSVTGIVDTWYSGLLGFYNAIVVSVGLNRMTQDRNSILNNDRVRREICKISLQQLKKITFNQVEPPNLSDLEIAAYIKLINSAPTGLSQQFQLNRQMAWELPKVFIFGRSDPLENNHLTQEMFYRRCYEHPTNQLLAGKLKLVQADLLRRCRELDVELDLTNLQSNFCWNFEQTGHNAHKRRPKEIAKILRIYFIVLEELERAETLQRSRL